MRNACLDAALAELDAVGIRDYQLARGGKHLQLRWTVAGRTLRMLTIPLTPSDWRSPQNTRSDLRRLLREDGLLESNGARAAPKPESDQWRRQLEDLIRQLNRVHVPEQVQAERGGLQAAYDHFNKELFDGKLPDVFITYQRKARSLGYFSADRFNGRLDKTGRHELALNPDGFINESDMEICSTLVHEQHHVWQHVKGTAPKRGYHDREWAAKMKLNGLQPTSTGMADGRETGQHMTHLIVHGGKFEQSYKRLAASKWRLNLESALRPNQQKGPSSKTKFTCVKCGQNAWGKPDLAVTCTPCRVPMRAAA